MKTILFAIITLVASNQAIAEAVETSFRADALARAEAVEIGERSDVHAANLDPAKEAAIRKLLEQQGIKDTFERVVSQIVENAGPQVSANLPPGKYRLEVRYSSGLRRGREFVVADTPLRGTIDDRTPEVP